jgi:hypothetical protein
MLDSRVVGHSGGWMVVQGVLAEKGVTEGAYLPSTFTQQAPIPSHLATFHPPRITAVGCPCSNKN